MGFESERGSVTLRFFISRTEEPSVFWTVGPKDLGYCDGGAMARLAPVLKSFVGERNNDQGSAHVCRWWKSVTLPPLDQPCDPRNFRSIGFVFRH
jgi:hypothetical protein